MKLKKIITYLEEMAPTAYAEDFDNVGLLVGDLNQQIAGVLICHDALEAVVDEAIEKKCNLIVCFHPIIFSGLKKLTGKNYVERSVIKAIKNDVAIYSVHTGLDNHPKGVNKILCDLLGIKTPKILQPKQNFIKKLYTYVPKESFKKVQQALFEAGAGKIGEYSECSFSTPGVGGFLGNQNTNPVIGEKQKYEEVNEVKLEVIFERHVQAKVIQALKKAHPYEEVAYEIMATENTHQHIGLGMIGYLAKPVNAIKYLELVKEKVGVAVIRHSDITKDKIQKIAVLGGSGSSAIGDAKVNQADLYITSDLKYHDFFQAENQMIIADVGHFESEKYVKNYIYDYLSKKMINFAIILSSINTNPVNYL